MKVQDSDIDGVKIITPKLYGDERGFFVESYGVKRYMELSGIGDGFVQDNVSSSVKGVLRGLHFQSSPHAQGKLVSVLSGRVFDVAVDLRQGSQTYGHHVSVELSAPQRESDGEWLWQQFWIPPGFAHGFLALEDHTIFTYKCTQGYAPDSDGGIWWNDPEIAIQWPEIGCDKIISEKDAALPYLKDLKL